MKKKFLVGLATVLMSMTMFFSMAAAAVIDIYVTPGGDAVNYRSWWYGGNARWTETGANPNVVSHSYEPGNGNAADSSLTFDLDSFTETIADITSVTFNYKVLSIWTDGRDDVGSFSGGGSVLASNGTGWKSFDVTSYWQNLSNVPGTINYSFAYTGWSGFTFGSAEGGDPAYLRIITTGGTNPVPEPATMLLFGLGLLGLAGTSRKNK